MSASSIYERLGVRTLINAAGSLTRLSGTLMPPEVVEAMAEAAKFCTDDTAQLLHYQEDGYFQKIPHIHADLGELAVGTKPGRETDEEITMAANLGLAIDDMAVAPLIYKNAIEKNIGTWLRL